MLLYKPISSSDDYMGVQKDITTVEKLSQTQPYDNIKEEITTTPLVPLVLNGHHIS